MAITKNNILDKTHYGLNIYAHILRHYYPNKTVLSLSGKECKPTKNPFTNNTKTLKIWHEKDHFMFKDLRDKNMKGDVFDFAAHHYKMTGIDLLNKINVDMLLRIDENFNLYQKKKNVKNKTENSKSDKIKFSFFSKPVTNIFPAGEISVTEAYLMIKSKSYKERTEKLRRIKDKSRARRYKAQNFDYATFSGIFSKRNDKALLHHSGLLTVDFDNISDISGLKQALLNDEYFETVLLFVSPSGNGLKWIIPIDISDASHQKYFLAVSNYIKSVYNIEIDKSGKDVSRACFLSYDPDVFLNPKFV
jgi:hypothetical protein